jgi:putative NADPH-quinone reductase
MQEEMSFPASDAPASTRPAGGVRVGREADPCKARPKQGEMKNRMRVLILYANPVDKSFGAALRARAVETLRSQGHDVDDCDLYREAFDPVLSARERIDYNNTKVNQGGVAVYAERLLAADGLVLIYPVWNEGFPAILKGFFDRVFIPGVSFNTDPNGVAMPNLGNLKKLAAVCTYGAGRLSTLLLGDPPRRIVKRLLRALPGHSVRCDYLAHYGMNRSTPEQRAAFLARVKRAFESW